MYSYADNITITSDALIFIDQNPKLKYFLNQLTNKLVESNVEGQISLVEDPDSGSQSVRFDVTVPFSQDELDKQYIEISLKENVNWETRYKLSLIKN